MRSRFLILAVCLAASSMTLLATHHSFTAYFDSQQPFKVAGSVVKVDWVVPAVFVHVKVEDPVSRQTTTYAFEAESRNYLERIGLSKDMFREGETISVIGFRSRPGSDLSETVADRELAARVRAETAASAAQFEFANGTKVPVAGQVPEL